MIGAGPEPRRKHALFTEDRPTDCQLLTCQELFQQILSQKEGARTIGVNGRILCGDSIRSVYEVGTTPTPPNPEAGDKIAHGKAKGEALVH